MKPPPAIVHTAARLRGNLFTRLVGALLIWIGAVAAPAPAADTSEPPPVSDATRECIGCHEMFHPGIVADWRRSRHARTSPARGLSVRGLEKRMSANTVADALLSTAVGCAECHTAHPLQHPDSFAHNGYSVHTVVTPRDCAVCHPTEDREFSENIMSHAADNLENNALYAQLRQSIIGTPALNGETVTYGAVDKHTNAQACRYCHGTVLRVTGTVTRDTVAGALDFPVIAGWPNQGVGRHNPDGSRGTCSACHTRHRFAIATARKPYTCKECHVGPDVPAYKVYSASKHGNIFETEHGQWDFDALPWRAGTDFSAPTCATCHISLVTTPDGEVTATRSHRMNDRLPWRLFGLIYAHPHPKAANLTHIRNKDGAPLPTAFDGTVASEHLIDRTEQENRRTAMQGVCGNCHGTGWIAGHWRRFESTIQQTNAATRTATQLMQDVWAQGLALGGAQGHNPFDEGIEKKWCDIWLLYANTIRFSSAMGGGGDYAVFANGAYQLSQTLQEMNDWRTLRMDRKEKTTATAPAVAEKP